MISGGVSEWNGSTWSALGSYTNLPGGVSALACDGSGNLYAGSYTIDRDLGNTGYIAKWNGSAWSALASGLKPGSGSGAVVCALFCDRSGNLYAGGGFVITNAVGVIANNIAKWDGIAWSALGPGIGSTGPGSVYALALDTDENLYAGGWFTTASGVTVNNIAKWDGNAWSALGSGVSGVTATWVLALACDSSGNLYAGGDFSAAGTVAANNIAKWGGNAWSALGLATLSLNGYVCALALDSSGNLYAGGAFTRAGRVSANNIAKWNGSSWSALGSGVAGQVNALAFDSSGDLYVGGEFTTASGVSANNVAKWNGSTWSGLGSGVSGVNFEGYGPYVFSLALDKSGSLYAGGYFTNAGGVGANCIAKWNGSSWSALGLGVGPSRMRMVPVWSPPWPAMVPETFTWPGSTCTRRAR